MKAKIKKARELTKDYLDKLWIDWSEFRWEHPGIAGFIEGAVVIYWSLVISAWIMRFKHKELGWVDIVD